MNKGEQVADSNGEMLNAAPANVRHKQQNEKKIPIKTLTLTCANPKQCESNHLCGLIYDK